MNSLHKLLGVGLLLLAAVCANVLLLRIPGRLDLSGGRLYSLDGATRELVSGLAEDVTLRFYCSSRAEALPVVYKNFARRVEELLQAFAAAGDRIRVEVIDPEPDSPEEAYALRKGLIQRPLDQVDSFFFGLVADRGFDEAVIPLFFPEREPFLEYDIVRLIDQLGTRDRPLIGILTGLPRGRPESGPLDPGSVGPADALFDELERSFRVRWLPSIADPKVLDDLAALLVIHPRTLSDLERFRIDQYVLGGGPLLLAVDPSFFSERVRVGAGGLASGVGMSSDLPGLLESWGLLYDAGQVVADPANAARVTLRGGGPPASYPAWIELRELASDTPFGAAVNDLDWIEGGSFTADVVTNATLTPLARTSDLAGDVFALSLSRVPPRDIGRQLGPVRGSRILAAYLEGDLVTAFPGGRPLQEGEDEFDRFLDSFGGVEPDALTASIAPSRIVAFADVDFLLDRFAIRELGDGRTVPANDNLAFVLNAVDALTGNARLLQIRGKGVSTREFSRIREMQARAGEEFKERLEGIEARLLELAGRIRDREITSAGIRSGSVDPAAMEDIRAWRMEEAELRRERNRIIRGLRADVERIEMNLAFINVGLVPLAILAWGAFYFQRRLRGRN